MAIEMNVAEFKNRLSELLRIVRRGNEIVVTNRDEPIARLVPYRATSQSLPTIPPTRPLKDIDKIPTVRPKKLKPKDLEEALRWVKRERFRP